MELYKKHRPTTTAGMFGNKDTLATFDAVFQREEGPPHALLFIGPSGCGKTTLARIAASRLGVADADYYEYNTADFSGVDFIRDIRKTLHYAPSNGPCRVFLIDECHRLSSAAQDAILKMLEDCPTKVYFFLATTEPQKLIKTIKTRTTTFEMQPLSSKECTALLKKTARREKVTVPDEVIKQIVQDSIGSSRLALVILDTIKDLPEESMISAAKRTAAEQSAVIELCRALIGGKSWKDVAAILRGLEDVDPEAARKQILGYANAVLLKSGKPSAADVIDEFRENFFDAGKAGLTVACFNVVS